MLGRKIFSILCLLALTVLLGACGSDNQVVTGSNPGVTTDNNVDSGSSNSTTGSGSTSGSSTASVSAKSITGGPAEFRSLVLADGFISISNFKKLRGFEKYSTINLYFKKCTRNAWDLIESDQKDSSWWEKGLDFITGNSLQGAVDNCLGNDFSRSVNGEFVTREDNTFEVADLKTIVNNGSALRQVDAAAFEFYHNNVLYVIDLNMPAELNPRSEASFDQNGDGEYYYFSGMQASGMFY